jgi:hypothetical protein
MPTGIPGISIRPVTTLPITRHSVSATGQYKPSNAVVHPRKERGTENQRRVPPRLIQAHGDDESSESGLYASPCRAQHIRGFAWVDSCSDGGELLIGVQNLPLTALHHGLMVLRRRGGSEVRAWVCHLPRSIYSLLV